MLGRFDWNAILDQARARLGVDTDYGLARAVHVSHAAIAQYRRGVHVPGPEVCYRLAEITHENPLIYIAAAEADRARSPEARKRWLERMAAFRARPRKGSRGSRP